jgi:hypothetical protein
MLLWWTGRRACFHKGGCNLIRSCSNDQNDGRSTRSTELTADPYLGVRESSTVMTAELGLRHAGVGVGGSHSERLSNFPRVTQ